MIGAPIGYGHGEKFPRFGVFVIRIVVAVADAARAIRKAAAVLYRTRAKDQELYQTRGTTQVLYQTRAEFPKLEI